MANVFQVSCLHLLLIVESWDYRRMAFGFSFSYGRWGLISAYWFYLQSYPQSSVICFWLFASCGYLSFSVALSQLHCLWAGKGGNFHSEWRKESSLMERWDSSWQWRWEHESCCRGSCEWSLSLPFWGCQVCVDHSIDHIRFWPTREDIKSSVSLSRM